VAATRSADALLFGLAATDVPTVVGATSVLAAAALLAAAVPAWRAAQSLKLVDRHVTSKGDHVAQRHTTRGGLADLFSVVCTQPE